MNLIYERRTDPFTGSYSVNRSMTANGITWQTQGTLPYDPPLIASGPDPSGGLFTIGFEHCVVNGTMTGNASWSDQAEVDGKALDDDGTRLTFYSDGTTKDVTPHNKKVDYFTFSTGAQKFEYFHKTDCLAKSNPDPARTDLGVGELFSGKFAPPLPPKAVMYVVNATLYDSYDGWVRYQAQHTKGNVKVDVQIPGEKPKNIATFSVIEPSGIEALVRDHEAFAVGTVGSGMYINVTIQPTTVSFAALKVMEPSESTVATGYFTTVDQSMISHANHGADIPQSVGCNNLVFNPDPDQAYFDHASSYGWPLNKSGTYTYPIHAIWWVAGDTATHPLSGWTDQVMTLSSDGTMSIDKFGLHESHPVW